MSSTWPEWSKGSHDVEPEPDWPSELEIDEYSDRMEDRENRYQRGWESMNPKETA